MIINDYASKNTSGWLIFIILFILILLIILRHKVILIYKRIVESLPSISNSYKKHPSNSVSGLINKKVYSESGNYLGKVKDVILGKNRIENLKIKVAKKHKFDKKGIIISYKNVKGAGKIIIIKDKIAEHLEKFNSRNI